MASVSFSSCGGNAHMVGVVLVGPSLRTVRGAVSDPRPNPKLGLVVCSWLTLKASPMSGCIKGGTIITSITLPERDRPRAGFLKFAILLQLASAIASFGLLGDPQEQRVADSIHFVGTELGPA